jgi:hypothetical protein
MARNTSGLRKWQPGQSGNPGGNPKGLIAEVRAKFGGDVVKILEVFRDLALGKTPTGYDDVMEIKTSDRIKAGEEVISRVIGKPVQAIEGEVNMGMSPVQKALIDALALTPHERRARLAQLEAEDAADDRPADEID